MTRRHWFCAAALWGTLAAGSTSWALEISPIYGLQVLGGQYFFAQDKGALTGNASGVIAPALSFNEHLSLLPSLSSSYQGTKQVVDVVGAGTFVQEQMDHRIGAKLVWSVGASPWRLKPSASYRYQLLKETKNEEWSSGLFDYNTWRAGVEAEYVYYDPFSLRVGVDYFETGFPNYTSLESQVALTVSDQVLARELVGDRVLDTRNILGSIAVDGPLHPKLIAEGSATTLYQSFHNQPLVDDSGNLIEYKRQDFLTTLGLGLRVPHEFNGGLRLLASLDTAVAYNTSNQNNYDAQRTNFTPLHYNYGEVRLGPSLKLFFGAKKRPVSLGLSSQYWYRRYPHRRIQNSSGGYEGASLQNNNWMTATTLTYPMADHFKLIFNFQYGRANSNQRFEQFYTYNYRVANYLFGFSYDY